MRILQVHARHREHGGEDVVVEQEAALLRSLGHTVEAFLASNPTDFRGSVSAVLRAPWNVQAAREVLAAADAFQPDVVHVHNTWFALSPAVMSRLARGRFPVVVTVHNFRTVCVNGLLMRDELPCELCVGTHPGHGVVHRCYRGSAVLSASAAMTIGVARRSGVWERDVRRFLVLDDAAVAPLVAGGIPADLITVHPNFVPAGEARPAPPSTSTDIVYAGRLSPEKGIQVLLEAWRRVAPDGVTLHVYGDGPLRAELEQRAVPGVQFHGRVSRDHVAAVLRSARALIFPSICREMGPLIPLEAAAAGLPILVSDLVGIAGCVEEAGAGWTMAAGDAAALADRLRVLNDDAEIDRAGEAARVLHGRRFGPETALRTLQTTYELASYRRVTT